MNTNRGRRYALVQVGSLMLASCASAPRPIATEESAREFAATFLRVFENLDMAKFIECFAEDATVFFPAPETPMRYNGRGAIRDQFQLVFNAIKGDSKAGPPYHRLAPDLLQVQMLGETLAVVTFHLTGPSRVARRTLVLHHRGGRWLIAHLHASNVANR
jgi:ketosteroid isomerase-like protein